MQQEMDKARAEAVRAHEELRRGGASEGLKLRLATLQAAIESASQELMWRQKAAEELAAVVRCVELAQVPPPSPAPTPRVFLLLFKFWRSVAFKGRARLSIGPVSDWQAGGNRALVAEAARHMVDARAAMDKARSDADLQSKGEAAKTSLAAAEAWAGDCAECEAAVERGREALAAGSRDEAAGHCRAARAYVDGGLKSDALRISVLELEKQISACK